uniref:Rpn family recombination-promoting nuclease/putative transposase n=1 Tax=Wolbachia endosymbiont (group A) of Philonthus cognatus TaxID=2954046 RepID=UPI00222E2C1D|nr:Rpn family recombination-promoting nuclease/putative transposase [Wolbachia endosymbiont (group A) of Philonthus cognatus]
MKSTKLERSRMRRKVSRTVLQSSEEGRPSSLRQQYAEETTDEDLRKIAEKSPIIKLAYDELDKFHWNEKDLVAYEERVMDLQKEAAILEQKLDDATQKGRQEGIQIGHEKGKIEGKIEVAKNSLKAGVSIDVIAEITGLSHSEISQLKEKT